MGLAFVTGFLIYLTVLLYGQVILGAIVAWMYRDTAAAKV